MSRAWLISGASRGLGRALAEEALRRGDRVALGARAPQAVAELAERFPGRALAVALDVTDAAGCERAVASALEGFGELDVLVNNAGYGLLGAVEEVTEQEIRRQFETNFFGALALIRATLPHLRTRGRGHIVNVSSEAGYAARAGFGVYAASKFALEGLSEALAQELGPLGIRVTIAEPGPLRTDWVGPSLVRSAAVIEDYGASSGRMRAFAAGFHGHQRGDPAAAAAAIADVVAAPAPPLRLVLGAGALREWRLKLAAVARELDAWEPVAIGVDRDDGEELPPLPAL